MSRSLPQNQLLFLKSREGRRQATSALSSATAAWVVHDGSLHAYDYGNPSEGAQCCLDELQRFVAGHVLSPGSSSSPSVSLLLPVPHSPQLSGFFLSRSLTRSFTPCNLSYSIALPHHSHIPPFAHSGDSSLVDVISPLSRLLTFLWNCAGINLQTML